MPSRQLILNLTTATNLIDQLQHYCTILKESLPKAVDPVKPSKGARNVPTSVPKALGFVETEADLLHWLRKRKSMDLTESAAPAWTQVPSEATFRLLSEEAKCICESGTGVNLRLERKSWGLAVSLGIKAMRLGIDFPADYPSVHFRLRPCSAVAAEFSEKILQEEFRVFPPVSLTALVNLSLFYLNHIDYKQ